ncbi:DUF3147 family protein [Castellaniella sp.]|uniref:DUF3147 family protein n=1 Tax=Castellaniella sp. TaxID=1955812 RepID=UPI003A5990C4
MVATETPKRSDRLGSFIASLPLMTILVLIWLYVEKQPMEKISNHAWYTFWYVIPTLPMFLVFPALLSRLGFWPALGASALLTAVIFGLFAAVVQQFGVSLF